RGMPSPLRRQPGRARGGVLDCESRSWSLNLVTLPPGSAQLCLETGRESLLIAQRRLLEAGANARANPLEVFEIPGQCHCGFDVFVGRVRREFFQADARQNTQSAA